MLQELKKRIEGLLAEKDRVVVAIDGSCAAGKTTLGRWLQQQFACPVIPMDDFFLRAEQRTPERFAQPGGNIDYERFVQEVLSPLMEGKPFVYRPYDCQSGALREGRFINPGKLTVVEGSYSLHPAFGECYDLKIFLQVDEQTRQERILQRPAFLHKRFFEQWIPMEQLYFAHCAVEQRCDLVLTLPTIEL